MRLIDADVLLRKICCDSCGCEPDECGYIDEYRKDRCKAGQYVEDAPTVDAVPVVRCKDCRHWYKHHCAHGICATEKTNPDWFCADGERREE